MVVQTLKYWVLGNEAASEGSRGDIQGVKSMTGRKGNTIRIPVGYYTTRTIAAMIGRDPDTVTRWRKAGVLPVAREHQAGKLTVYLFDDAGLDVAKALVDQSKRNLTDRVAA